MRRIWSTGSFGLRFTLRSVCGSFVLAPLGQTDREFGVDLGRLKGRTIEPGGHRSEVPAVQEALF